jgi:hypothetical protein
VLRYAVRKSDPLYGYWFFKFYYEAFAEPLQILSKKFRPETESAIDELLDLQVDVYVFAFQSPKNSKLKSKYT